MDSPTPHGSDGISQSNRSYEIILLDNWNTAPICLWDGSPEEVMDRVEWVKKIKGLRDSADAGCVSCQILHSLVKTTTTDYDRHLRVYGVDGWYEIGVTDGIRADLVQQRCFDVFVPTDIGDPPRGIAQRLLRGESSRETSIEWAQRELSNCLQSHKWCQSKPTSFLPTRLINVSLNRAGGNIFLEDSSTVPPGSQYVTLSYCWGGVQPECLTTRETLPERQRCIPWTTLPQTFKDAIEFTRTMNIPYIWIDGVCIIQKDKEDWLREGGRMFHVYKNSYATIAAAGENPFTGLWPTSTSWQEKLLATIKLNGRSWPLYADARHDHYWEWDVKSTTKAQQNSYPLFRRAWTYQERLISPRVILFMGGEVAFQCFQKATCECGEINEQRKDDISSHRSDRLLAIGAVAEQVQAVRRGEDYLAGLWSGSLLDDLLWEIARDKRASPTAGPSWSWASWGVGPRGIFWYKDRGFHGFTTLAQIVEAKCIYSDGNPFGAVVSGRLVFQGRLLSCRALCIQGSIKMLLCERVPLPVSPPPQDDIKLDSGLPENGRMFHFSFYLFEIGKDSPEVSTPATSHFLVLQDVDKENGSYSRIGIARFKNSAIMNKLGKTKVVTIE
ncbi:hypothetical protein B7463_g11599, partial [Scytalidium lignicola]